jgi:hypothetical protein
MLGESVVIVVDGVLVSRTVRMPMSNHMAVFSAVRMAEGKVELVVARISGRRF